MYQSNVSYQYALVWCIGIPRALLWVLAGLSEQDFFINFFLGSFYVFLPFFLYIFVYFGTFFLRPLSICTHLVPISAQSAPVWPLSWPIHFFFPFFFNFVFETFIKKSNGLWMDLAFAPSKSARKKHADNDFLVLPGALF